MCIRDSDVQGKHRTIIPPPRGKKPVVYQDNQAAGRIIWIGKAGSTMTHLSKTQKVSISWANMVTRELVLLRDCNTDVMAADTFTKFFTQPAKWNHACLLIGIVPESAYSKAKFLPHPRPPTAPDENENDEKCKKKNGSPKAQAKNKRFNTCLLYTSPSPRDRQKSRMPSSA